MGRSCTMEITIMGNTRSDVAAALTELAECFGRLNDNAICKAGTALGEMKTTYPPATASKEKKCTRRPSKPRKPRKGDSAK